MATANYHPVLDCVVVETQWNEKSLIKQVPGARWDSQQKLWRVPASWASLVVLRGVFGDGLKIGDPLREWSWELYRDQVEPPLRARSSLTPLDDDVDELRLLRSWETRRGPNLYDFQVAGVQFMLRAGSGLLGDEPGSGKTPQTLSMIRAHLESNGTGLPALIIAPNSVKRHWARLCGTWLPHATPYVVDGTAAQRRRTLKDAAEDHGALVVINIESVRLFTRLAPYGSIRLMRCRECDPKHGDEFIKMSRCEVHNKELNEFKFETVVLDEAHRVKDPKAKQTRAIWHIAHGQSVRYRWALTGTPIANHPGDLWSIMHMVAPFEYPTRSQYVERFCLMSWNAFGGMDVVGVRPDTREELYKILDPRFRRMLKAVVLPQLPPKIREVRYVDMSPAQARAYRELEGNLKTRLADGTLLIAANQLVVKTRLMQFASASVTVERPDKDDIATWNVTMREPSPKVDALIEVLEDLGLLSIGYQGAPVLIAAEHLDLIDMIGQRLTVLGVPYATITGQVAPIDRDRALQDLQHNRIRVLLFSGKAGGVGLDMSAADTLINVQRSWSLVDEKQKEDRPHRPGAEKHTSIRIIDFITRGTVEEDQISRLTEKLERLEEITRDRIALADHSAAADFSLLDQEETQLLHGRVDLDNQLELVD